MRYEGAVFRPPSEAGSLIIQATVGCPHNKCAFCAMYRNSKFRIRPVSEIKEDLDMARDCYGPGVRTVFLADGNTVVMKTADLLEILTYAGKLFPQLERITVYGAARFIIRKSSDEWRTLYEAGLSRLHAGMESGDDEVLQRINKGATAEEIVRAGRLVKDAGIQLSEYVIIGVGGRELWRCHAEGSAHVLNAINPDFIRLRTFMPVPGAPMYELCRQGSFGLLSPYEALSETRLFIEHLNGIESELLSDHVSNYWNVNGKLPDDKEKMLAEIDRALGMDEKSFRSPEAWYL